MRMPSLFTCSSSNARNRKSTGRRSLPQQRPASCHPNACPRCVGYAQPHPREASAKLRDVQYRLDDLVAALRAPSRRRCQR
jgi:hypothetical protein